MNGIRIVAGMLSALVLANPITAASQSPCLVIPEWAALTYLHSGVRLRVIRKDGKSYTGDPKSASDSVIVLSRSKTQLSIGRGEIRQVYRSCPGSSARRSIRDLGLLGASSSLHMPRFARSWLSLRDILERNDGVFDPEPVPGVGNVDITICALNDSRI